MIANLFTQIELINYKFKSILQVNNFLNYVKLFLFLDLSILINLTDKFND